MIQLIQGYHTTATEKRAIEQVINSGFDFGRNKPNTKNYFVRPDTENKDKDVYNVTIGTKAVWTIGGDLKWQYSKIIIKHIKKNSNEQKQQ